MKEQKKKSYGITISVCFVALVLFFSVVVQAHHEGMPQGQHVMPNGQVMNADGTIASQERTFPIGIWVVIGFLVFFGLVIWFLSKSTRRSTELSSTKFK